MKRLREFEQSEQDVDEGDLRGSADTCIIDPPDGLSCVDRNGKVIRDGYTVRVCATGSLCSVADIVYEGFEDRSLALRWAEPGFMLNIDERGFSCVNAGDVEVVDS